MRVALSPRSSVRYERNRLKALAERKARIAAQAETGATMTYGTAPAPTAAAPKSGLLNGGSNWIPTSLGEDLVARAFAKADVIVGPAARVIYTHVN